LASLVVQLIVSRITPWLATSPAEIRKHGIRKNGLGWVLIIFAFVMATGSVFAWAWLPELQTVSRNEKGKERLESKSLEDLAGGMKSAGREGEVIGLRRRVGGMFRRVRGK
jgi:hypothetical protein